MRLVASPDAFSLSEGAVFHDQYEIVRRIDSGAMGTVYEVVDGRTKRRRALKVMLARFADNPEVIERFRREATITADIESEHVVETFDAGVDAPTGLPFLVMELLRGEDLGKLLARGPVARAELVALLMQAAGALDKMHGAGIVHRDLKPENLFITRRDDGSPRIKILDFGIAKVVEKAAPSATSTRNMGTPVYMSPEQVMGSGNVGPPADLYALGHLAYAMLTGVPYWLEDALAFETVYPLLLRIMEGASEPASARASRTHDVVLPEAFDAWFAKATAHAPEDRFKNATESIVALAKALDVPRPPLPSWVLEQHIATAPTLAPPGSTLDAQADPRESTLSAEPLLLVPAVPKIDDLMRSAVAAAKSDAAKGNGARKAGDAAKGDAARNAGDAAKGDAARNAGDAAKDAAAGDDAATAGDAATNDLAAQGDAALDEHAARKDEALRTLSPVSTLPDTNAVPAPPSAQKRSRVAALFWLGAAFFATGVLAALFITGRLARIVRGGDPPSALASPSLTVAAPPLAPASPTGDPSSPAASPGSIAPGATAEPAADPTPSASATSSVAGSSTASTVAGSSTASASDPAAPGTASAAPGALRPATPIKRIPRPTHAPSTKPASKPSRPYGDPTRDL
jgi:serine/threonine protein kinase